MKKPAFVGIDYSMTSPSVCVYVPGDGAFAFETCQFYFLSHTLKCLKNAAILPNLHAAAYMDFTNQEERFDALAWWCIGTLAQYTVTAVAIEDYAFAAKGKIFHIGENTGQLKHQLWKHGIKFVTAPPTVIKKHATGKGNANKEQICSTFVQETGINLPVILGTTTNPTSDIIDSFYICKWLLDLESKKGLPA